MDIYPAVSCFLSSLPSTTITTTASISFAYCIIMMSLIYLLQTVWIPCSSTTGGRYDGCYFERVYNPLRKMLRSGGEVSMWHPWTKLHYKWSQHSITVCSGKKSSFGLGRIFYSRLSGGTVLVQDSKLWCFPSRIPKFLFIFLSIGTQFWSGCSCF